MLYRSEHDITYENHVEEIKRFNVFKANLREIEEHNALYEQGLVTYQKGINQFTDMTEEEFEEAYLKTSVPEIPKFNGTLYTKPKGAAPASVDWRTTKQVTMVKDQGKCRMGSWTFSLTGVLEAAHFRKTNRQAVLSEQQLIDCAVTEDNRGCSRGFVEPGYDYVKKFGLESASDYPYTAMDSNCKFNSGKVVAATKIFDVVSLKNEANIHSAVSTIGPVSIGMNGKVLKSYRRGILVDPNCGPRPIDHFALIVGYGSEGRRDYWIVKNSWGTGWGENGYFRIQRDVNMCGIADLASYPRI